MTAIAERAPWTYDDFQPGEPLGETSLTLDEERIGHWSAIYGPPVEEDTVPSGLLMAALMEAYLATVAPRPPGNIHASQRLVFGAPARPGDRLDAAVTCLAKEVRKSRGWVTFGVDLRRAGEAVLFGEVRVVWAR